MLRKKNKMKVVGKECKLVVDHTWIETDFLEHELNKKKEKQKLRKKENKRMIDRSKTKKNRKVDKKIAMLATLGENENLLIER